MHRFVACTWNPASPGETNIAAVWRAALEKGSRWQSVLDAPGLQVWLPQTDESRNLPISTSFSCWEGIAVGVLFERGAEGNGRVATFSPELSERAVSSQGDNLIAEFWGNYVALMRNPLSGSVTVLRDPCGAVPCFVTRASGVDLFFAHPVDITRLPHLTFSIDWKRLQAFLYDNFLSSQRTGLLEIDELLPGERLERSVDGTIKRSWAWSPATFAATPDFRPFSQLAPELRTVTKASLKAFGNLHQRILVQLSGGLDSSIVLNLLQRVSGADVQALHIVAGDYESYELALARIAAAKAGVKLIETPLDPEGVDLRAALDIPPLAQPTTQIMATGGEAVVSAACAAMNAQTVMAGHGGDALFLQRSIATHLPDDYRRLKGVDLGLLSVAYDAAILQTRSVWSVLHQTCSRPAADHDLGPENLEPRRLANCVVDEATIRALPHHYLLHPWQLASAGLAAGKIEQIRNIIALYNYYVVRGYGVELDALNPLFSQPVLEFILRVPTFEFARGGIDRALEREAFADVIPQAVRQRTHKGFINHQLLSIVRHNLPFLRSLILDGELIRQPWISRARVETMLSPDALIEGGALGAIYNLAAAEIWLSAWRSVQHSVAP